MKYSFKICVLMTSMLWISGCSAGPDYESPALLQDSSQWASLESAQDRVSTSPILNEWWTAFQDPVLSDYIAQARENNKSLEIALANIRAARARRAETSAAFWPDISADAAFDRGDTGNGGTGSSGVRTTYDAGFDASWEVDVFGGNRRADEAAEARYEVTVAEYQDILLSTFSEVARNYFEARGLQKQIAITEQNAELLRQTYDLVNVRSEAGESSEFDVTRAQGEYQLILARLPNLRAGLRERIYTLSILLGRAPEYLLADMQQAKPLPAPPDIVPVGLRSDLLRRRPDIRAAERELAASTADIGAEMAELFPKFALTGSYGSSAAVFGDLFMAAAKTWSFGFPITWSIFEGGAIRARVAAEKAEAQAALANYELTVLTVLRDAETALTRYGESLETRRRLEVAVQTRRQSVAFANDLFQSGEEDFLSVIDSERELVSAEDQLVVAETESIINLIALYTTLGGGWETATPDEQP